MSDVPYYRRLTKSSLLTEERLLAGLVVAILVIAVGVPTVCGI